MAVTSIEVPMDEQQKPGNYRVKLASCGNIDHDEDPFRPLPGVASPVMKADTMREAAEICMRYILANDLGGGQWAGGEITLDGKVVAQVSYNGRVWYPGEA